VCVCVCVQYFGLNLPTAEKNLFLHFYNKTWWLCCFYLFTVHFIMLKLFYQQMHFYLTYENNNY